MSSLIQTLFKESEEHSELAANQHIIEIEFNQRLYNVRVVPTRYAPTGEGIITLRATNLKGT